MKSLVIYDSVYGRTEKIALAVGEVIGARVLKVDEMDPAALKGHDLLVIGSPTHGGSFTEKIRALLDAMPALEGCRVTLFDTRTAKWSWIFGYAAERMAKVIEKKGGDLAAPPQGFFVLGTRGPLKDGEIERAADWAKELILTG
jgi:flavodoxin I